MRKRSRLKKVITSLTLSVVLVAGICPLQAFAEGASGEGGGSEDVDAGAPTAVDLDTAALAAAEGDDLVPPEAEAADAANSWRYVDGQPIDSADVSTDAVEEGSQADDADEYGIMPLAEAWGRNSDGTYSSSNGSIINGAIAKGVDVSEHNGRIDWEAMRADGIDFAILRCGYGMDYTSQDDDYWEYNVSECERLDIPYGVYLYSYATSTSRASSEADHALRLLQGHNPQMPVFYDLEESSMASTSNRSLLASMAQTFCDTLTDAGYEAGVYANLNWWNNYLTDSTFNYWERWVAQYNYRCDYSGAYATWQCTSSGSANGTRTSLDFDFRITYPVDVRYTDWYVTEDDYSYVVSQGLMTGYSNYFWGAKDNITRGQLATILWRMTGRPVISNTEHFEDVDYDMYYGDAISWAHWAGVVTGFMDEDGEYRTFGPDYEVTREDFAVMLARYASFVRGIDTWSDCSALDARADGYQVSDYAREAVSWAIDKDVIRGVGGADIFPLKGALRTEASSMIHRYCTTVL